MNQTASIAASLPPEHRKNLALIVLAKNEPITDLAAREKVSRKFLYQQKRKANIALNQAFTPISSNQDVLFYLPVTKTWLKQLILALILICHSSYRGVKELLRDLFDTQISIASIHNLVHSTAIKAKLINEKQDLSSVQSGLHDEIFQGSQPVLAGVDAFATYCYLLTTAEHRDEDTWGFHLLNLNEQQGLNPEYTIADGGKGLRAGQAAAWPGTPCHGDVFHIQYQCTRLACYLERRATGAMTRRQKLETKMEQAKKKRRGHKLSKKLTLARLASEQAIQLAADVEILINWLSHDVLALAGPDYIERLELFDFIVEELRVREVLCPHRIRPVRTALENQRDDLLSFAQILDGKLAEIAQRFQVPLYLVRSVCLLPKLTQSTNSYWQTCNQLHHKLPGKFYFLVEAVTQAMKETPRASSMVENLNSRLRNYFF